MTEQEIRQLAIDIVDGKVFTDKHCERVEDMRFVFTALAMQSKESRQSMLDRKVAMVYEYNHLAAPRGINGYPNFYSFKTVVEEDFKKLWPLVIQLEKERAKFLKPEDKEKQKESET